MIPEAFSEAWAHAWCSHLTSRPAFLEAARNWDAPVVLAMTRNGAGSETRAVYVRLAGGTCHEARAATAADLASAPIAFEASAGVWRDLFGGTLPPVTALLGGKLRLVRGTLTTLLPFAGAARELIIAAGEIETRFPEGWD